MTVCTPGTLIVNALYLVPSAVHDLRIGRFVDNLPPLSSVFNGSQQTITSQRTLLVMLSCQRVLGLPLLLWPEVVVVVVSGVQLKDCVAPYVDIVLHRGRFWAKSAASESVRWCCFRSCWTVLSHVMRGRPSCLLQSARGEANMILLASALLSMRIICQNRVSRHDWIIAVSLGCFVSLRTSSFRGSSTLHYFFLHAIFSFRNTWP